MVRKADSFVGQWGGLCERAFWQGRDMDNSSQVVATDDETRQQTSALKGWRRVQLVLILGSLSAFGPLSIDMYLPSLPALSRDLNASASAAQLTLSACLLGLAFGQVIAGPLSDTLGRRRPLLIGLIAYTVASLLCVVAPSVYILIALRLVQGMAGAAGIVIARAIVRDMFSGVDVARFFSILMLVSGIAPIAAPLVGGLLLRFTSWRGVFVVLAVLVTLMLLAVITGLRETLPVERRQSGKLHYTLATFRRLLLDRLFVGYALSCGLAFAAMFAYISGSLCDPGHLRTLTADVQPYFRHQRAWNRYCWANQRATGRTCFVKEIAGRRTDRGRNRRNGLAAGSNHACGADRHFALAVRRGRQHGHHQS